ncbi:hypothetical protein QZH41_020162, partial [Actinostola sp. cb2023]
MLSTRCSRTPHPATGIPPYEATRGTAIRTKLDYVGPNSQASEEDEQNKNDTRKIITSGAHRMNLYFTQFVKIQGSRTTARRTDRTVCHDASHFKLVNTVINTTDETE